MRAFGITDSEEKVLQELEKFATYDPHVGGFIVISDSRGHRPSVGSPLGTLTRKGYLYAKVLNRVFPIHWLVWLWHYGYLPTQLDHIDRNKVNNTITNLREATSGINGRNRDVQKNNKLGFKGIRQLPSGKYQLRISGYGKKNMLHLGTFSSIEEALEARKSFIEENPQLNHFD